MASISAPETVCLDVAVDHRIRALFRDISLPARSESTGGHVRTIKKLGSEMGLPPAEVNVTGQLAKPETTGGLAVILQQPRDYHPFDEGLQEVMETCPTLFALNELFYTVSCGTIDLSHVSTFDLLPYTTPQEIKDRYDHSKPLPYMTPHEVDQKCDKLRFLRDRFDTCVEAVCQKKPDVVLCAGRYRLPPKLSKTCVNSCIDKGEAWKLENINVGCTFQDWKGKDQTRVALKDAAGRKTPILRVNAPHPSFVLHYGLQHKSCFKQLLLLAVSKACSLYAWDGDWKEFAWMNTLRGICAEKSRRDYDAKNDGLDDKQIRLRYCKLMKKIDTAIRSIARPHLEHYQNLLNSSLTRLLNDASLALRYMLVNDVDISLDVIWDTHELVRNDFASLEWDGNERVEKAITRGMQEVAKHVGVSHLAGLFLDCKVAMDIFLDTAKAVELILWDLKAKLEHYPLDKLAEAVAALEM